MSTEAVLFTKSNKDVTLADVFKGIYTNSTKKDKQLQQLILRLQPLVTDLADATIVVPLIKEYMEVSVKNDEQLVKLAAIAQRLLAVEQRGTSGDIDGLGLTDKEKEELKLQIKEVSETSETLDSKIEASLEKLPSGEK